MRARGPYFGTAGLLMVLAVLLVLQLVGRYEYRQAVNSFNRDELSRTESFLTKSQRFAFAMFPGDRTRLRLLEGELVMRRAENAANTRILLDQAERARELFGEVVARNPLDLDGYTGLARATVLLEKLYPFLKKESYPHKALPLFEQLLLLMPANIYSRSLLTQYYHSHGMTEELRTIVGKTVGLYPPIYFQLKNQPFYSLTMNEMLKKELKKAITDDVFPDAAARVLADIATDEEDYPAAIDYFLKTEPSYAFGDNGGYYLELGRLYLKAKRMDEAQQAFMTALEYGSREERLERIYHIYRGEKADEAFLPFALDIEEKYPSLELVKILKARSYLDLEQFELARSQLIRIESDNYRAESFYLEARIAEKLEDWDTMELRSQRATVLDPADYRYHLLFSRALQKQQKFIGAEEAATAAIEAASSANPWTYNHRAWLRWHLKDYDGALADWEKAVSINPRNAGFYANMARVYEKGGNIKAALNNLRRAVDLDPDNTNLRKRLAAMVTEVHAPGKGTDE